MESKPDNLHEAEGRKDEELQQEKPAEETSQKEEESLDEDSMVAAREGGDAEVMVSTDEEVSSGEPDYSGKEQASAAEREKETNDDGLDEKALVRESGREEAETLISGGDVMTDEELEKHDDSDEVHSDEDEHDEHASHEVQMPDYGEYDPEKLVAEAEKLLKNEEAHKIKDQFEAIRRNLLKQLNEERQHKLEDFIKDGGVEMDFEYIQPLREKFRKIFSEYRSQRQRYYKELQDKLNSNFAIKQGLIEKIREIVNTDESIGDTFKEFNHIQQEWRNTGPVPRSESADLWRTYHHHVENFYEYIKINKELRDLDFKKNREAKEKLIAEAEKLGESKNLPEAFKALQGLHKKWKQVGPVERENRDPMWDRFSEATSKLHLQRDEHYAQLKEKAGELIEEKKKLITRLEEINYQEIDSHHKWQEAIKKVEALRSEFRKMGRINHPENDEIWDRFRGILRDFNHAKNQYYKDLKKSHHDNLAQKRELVEIAESLKDSDDWRETTNEMKRIQAQWKRIGHVPKSESDKIWKKFRGACNHYFERLTQHNKEQDKELEVNYTQKTELLQKLKDFETSKGKQKESVSGLKDLISQWKDTGRVPRNKAKIDADFNKVLDEKFKSIDLDRKESQRIRFENKMETLSDQGGERELKYERETVNRQIDEARKELGQLETNLSFFTSSKPDNPIVKEGEKNIQRQKEQIELLEQKHKMLNVKIRELERAGEEPEEKKTEEGDGEN